MTHGIDSQSLFPSHVAFIMDGNRRWAKKNNLPIIDGHKKGAEIIKKIVRKSIKLNIKYLTFYGFSTENWNRSKDEVIQLQSLLKLYLDSETENFMKNKKVPEYRYWGLKPSIEYFKSIDNDALISPVVTPVFKEIKNGKAKIISFFAKKARGMMARFIIQNKIDNIEDIKGFNLEGYSFDESLSSEFEPVFVRAQA